MGFHSILFEKPEDRRHAETLEVPDFFVDLNLDQIIKSITAGRQEYHLEPFFYRSLGDSDAITYRQAIMRDLESEPLLEHIRSFAQKMRVMRRYRALVEKLTYHYHKAGWFLEAVDMYCDAVRCLAHDLSCADVQSCGFLAFRDYVTNYAKSDQFTSLMAEAKKLKADLSTVRYCLLIKGNSVRVRRYESESDYSCSFAKLG